MGVRLCSQAQAHDKGEVGARPCAYEIEWFHAMETPNQGLRVRRPRSPPTAILRAMRFDEPELAELRRWGLALREADREESVAAGRAILMLIEELERLRLDLRRTRERLDRMDRSDQEAAPAPVASTLHDRLQRILARDQDSGQLLEVRSEAVEETDPTMDNDSETAAARSWIETLRRQK
jgi:hypothetical protein